MAPSVDERPARLLTSNSELAREGISNWTLPAWVTTLPGRKPINVCPSAGVCSEACYAMNGTYLFPDVVRRHQANLAYVMDDRYTWAAHMVREIQARHAGRWVRVHDAGDFFAAWYLTLWLDIMRDCPATGFYCYTKEVQLFLELVEPDAPANFRWVYSLGGKQDHLIPDGAPRADVFPDEGSIPEGWTNQEGSDLIAVSGAPQVAIPSNNIPAFRKRLAGRSFGQWQAERDAARADRLARAGKLAQS